MSDQDDCSSTEPVVTKDDMTVNIYELNQHGENTEEQHGNHEVVQGESKQKSVLAEFLRLGSFYATNLDGKCEETEQEIIDKLSELETFMRKKGLDLRSLASGSLQITVSVHDTYALENLMKDHKNGKFIRELAKIFVTESEVEHFCRRWSSHIDENMYTAVLSKLKTVGGHRQKLLTEWDRNQVREWLSMELRLEPEIANRVYEQEFIGRNLLIYKQHVDIFKEFQLQKTDLRMIQYGLEEKIKEVHEEHNWEPITDDCSASRVSELLLKVGLPPIHAKQFINMNMTGFKFLKYREEHFMEDFNLAIGPLLLVLHMQKVSQNIQKTSIAEISKSSNLSDGQASTVTKFEFQNKEEISTAVKPKYFKESSSTDITIPDGSSESISSAHVAGKESRFNVDPNATTKNPAEINKEELQPEVPSSSNTQITEDTKVEEKGSSTRMRSIYVGEGISSPIQLATSVTFPTAVSEKEDNNISEDASDINERHLVVTTTEIQSKQEGKTPTEGELRQELVVNNDFISQNFKDTSQNNEQEDVVEKIECKEISSQYESSGTSITSCKDSASDVALYFKGTEEIGSNRDTYITSPAANLKSVGGKTDDAILDSVMTLVKSTNQERQRTDRTELKPSISIGAIATIPKSKETNIEYEMEGIQLHQSKKRKSSKKKRKKGVKTDPEIFHFSEAEHKIRKLLLGDVQLKATFDIIYNAILVVNVPGKDIEDINNTFSFISKVKWKAVFDFDANSNINGICNVMRSSQEVKLYGIKDLANVTSPSVINYAEFPTWIFCNGRTDIKTGAQNRLSWIKNRSHDMDKAVEFFSNTYIIRQDTGLVIFILLSNNIDVLSEAFRKFYTDFGIHRIVFICETTQVFKEWCNLVTRYCTQDELQERLVVVPLKYLNDIILRMQGVNVKSDYTLPTVNGKGCSLWGKDKSKWVDLSVITYNECDNTDMKVDNPDFDTFCKDKELDFYKGEEVSFWNFKFNDMGYDHVCQRDVKYKMVKGIGNEIKRPKQQVKILGKTVFHWFHLFHQPGAGGSTVVKHVLWEFRQKYRCVLLNKITDQTEAQILEMWSYGEQNGRNECLPLVIVSDNLPYNDLTDMVMSLEYTTKGIPGRRCIIVNCRRYMSQDDVKKETEISGTNTVAFLEQSLSDREKEWFQTKHDHLETKTKSDTDFKPDRLLAFMVMKEEFRSEYVEDTVSRVLDDLKEQHPQEFELVKFCSLFSKFERDSAIPISCCDEFIGFPFSSKKKRECPWEYTRSEGCTLLLIKVDIHELGSIQGLKVVHPIVADFILKDVNVENLSSLMTHFLNSKLLTARSHSREYLAARTHDLLIKRNQTGLASTTKQQFSALILAIQEVNKEDACNVLIEGFNTLQDPMIAQQIARYYIIVLEDYSKALEFIEMAIAMRKDNACLWDTKGQIYRSELIRSFHEKYVIKRELLSIDDSCRLLELAFDGIASFHKSQRINKNISMSSFSGEVDITFKMLDVLTCLDIVTSADGRNILKRYLVDKDFKPVEFSKWAEYHQAMKGLMRNVRSAIETMTNYFTFQKDWSNFTDVEQSAIKDTRTKVNNFLLSWETHFGGCIAIEETMTDMSAETADDLRRLKAQRLGGFSIGKVFKLVKEERVERLLEIRHLLLQNSQYSAFDLKIIILTNLALSAVVSVKKCRYDLPSIKEMIDMAKEFDQCDQKEGYNSLYAPFFLLILLWPRDQPVQEYDNSLMKKSLQELRKRWGELQKQGKQEEGVHSIHPLYGRHLKNQRTRKKPMVHFFLGSGKGLKALVHQCKISSNPSRFERDLDQVWKSSCVKENLLKVEGMLSETNEIIFKHKYTDEPIHFPLASTSNRTIKSREEVVFYIGFSWGGPVAYYVKPKATYQLEPVQMTNPGDMDPLTSAYGKPNTSYLLESATNVGLSMASDEGRSPILPQLTENQPRRHLSILEYKKDVKNLKKKLTEIETLKAKERQGETLEKNQETKLKREHDLKQQLKKLEDDFKKQQQIDMEEI